MTSDAATVLWNSATPPASSVFSVIGPLQVASPLPSPVAPRQLVRDPSAASAGPGDDSGLVTADRGRHPRPRDGDVEDAEPERLVETDGQSSLHVWGSAPGSTARPGSATLWVVAGHVFVSYSRED